MDKLQLAGLTMVLGDSGLVAGSTTTLSLGAEKNYCINGKAYTQAAVSAVQPSIIDATTGETLEGIEPGYGAVILIGASSAESTTLKVVQGPQSKLDTNSAAYTPGAFIVPPQFGPMPDDFCPFGYVVVKVATDYTPGASYIFGLSNTTATGAQSSAATAHANTFTSIMALPTRPQSA